MSRRPYIPLKNKLAALVGDKLGLSMDERKTMTASQVLKLVQWDHIDQISTGGHPKAHWNLQILLPLAHSTKTHSLIGNSDRRFRKLFRRKTKRTAPKAKIASRPMPCGRNSKHRKKLNGKVVPRDAN